MLPCASLTCWMPQCALTISSPDREIGWKRRGVTGEDNTRFGSTGNGASACGGHRTAPKRSRSWIIIDESTMTRLRTHPGEVLREEYLVPLDMSARALAK